MWSQRTIRLFFTVLLISSGAFAMEPSSNKAQANPSKKIPVVALQSNENETITIPLEAALCSKMIKNMLGDLEENIIHISSIAATIPITTNQETLEHIVATIPITTNQETLQHIANCLNDIQGGGDSTNTLLTVYVQSLTPSILQELLHFANFLHIQPLLEPCVKAWAQIANQQTGRAFGDPLKPAVVPEMSRLAAQHYNGLAKLKNWLIGSACKPSIKFEHHASKISSLVFHPNKPILAWCGQKKIELYDVTNDTITTLKCHADTSCICFSPNGNTLASGASDGTINLWNINNCKRVLTLKQDHHCRALCFNHDGTLLASGSDHGKINLWNSATGTLHKTFDASTHLVYSVCFSPNGTLLAAGVSDTKIKLYNIDTGSAIPMTEQHTDWIRSACFSPDGKMVASGSDDKSIKFWDVNTTQLITTLSHHISPIYAIQFNPGNSRMILSVGSNKEIKLWKNSSHNVWFCAYNLMKPEIHARQVRFDGDVNKIIEFGNNPLSSKIFTHTASFSHDGKLLASESDDGMICLWNIELLEAIADFFDSHITLEQAMFLDMVYKENKQKQPFDLTDQVKKEYAIFQTLPEALKVLLAKNSFVITKQVVTAHKKPKKTQSSCKIQ